MRDAVDAVAAIFLGNARLLRAIIHRAAVDPEVFRRGSRNSIDLARRFRAAAGGDERAADGAFRVVYAALVQRVVYGAQFESDVALSDEEFVHMLGHVAERFMTEEKTA
jgi:hypothetical protein